MKQNISPTGESNPFEKTFMMMEIEKRDVEIKTLQENVERLSQIIKEMSIVLSANSSAFLKATELSADDWREFGRIASKYGVQPSISDVVFQEFLNSSWKLVVQEFLRYKLGTACAENINGS